MDPYKPCWCGSGKKWKWCHKGRQDATPANINQLLNEMFLESRRGLCLHPDAPVGCGAKIIKAHTVQRGGGLKAVAEKDHVLSPKAGLRRLPQTKGLLVPEPVGINNASTFMGFCEIHDGAMFRPAEHQVSTLTDEVAFLLGFRAVSYELLAKITAERWATTQREADRGQPFERQAEIQMRIDWTLQGTRMAIRDMRRWKDGYDSVFRAGDYAAFRYRAIRFDGVLPLVGCGAFSPEFDFAARRLQYLGRPSDTLEHVTLNIGVIDGRSVAVLGWLGTTDGHSAAFVDSFATLAPDGIANMLVQLAFEHIENIYLRPSWWAGLSDEMRETLMSRAKNGTISQEREPDCLIPDGRSYLTPPSIMEVKDHLA